MLREYLLVLVTIAVALTVWLFLLGLIFDAPFPW